jgi:hypothetical protein
MEVGRDIGIADVAEHAADEGFAAIVTAMAVDRIVRVDGHLGRHEFGYAGRADNVAAGFGDCFIREVALVRRLIKS